ncbi:FAD-dependent oxidoreductase [Streptomyces thermoviolaceus]|uniref:NAD(P)/FAD-dependent oxidoreductase n=1 Tax=Streptomyces thermoviolaceus TaxID=1952 RepID=UPI00203ABEC5|nr:FAD-dependent oxidoreductase [Streptomyces thermoviolaceus]MCM3266809.1 FAD-dependent oxidoreductase [Streptomyces thermoviolaceus]
MSAARPRVAVVGAGAAGLAAAEALRRLGWDGEITFVGDEPRLPYDRPPLSKQVLGGAWEPERTTLRDSTQLAALDLDLRLGTRAVGYDPAERTLTLDGDRGDVLRCAGVIAATGVTPRTLPGAEGLQGVHVLRTLDDALALRRRLAVPGRRLAVVGSGVLGAEAAAVARGLGHHVELIGSQATPMERVLGHEVGQLLAEVHRAHGVTLRPGQAATCVTSEDGRATGVVLADGTVVEADDVLLAVGSDPAVGWLRGPAAEAAGVDLSDGLGCDEFCAAAEGLYGAGDVARWYHPVLGRHLRVEHRMNTGEQGLAAARNLLAELDPERFGERRPFAPVPYFWSDQYDLKLQAYGVLAGAEHAEVLRLDKDPLRLAALYGTSGRATGALAVGLTPRQARSLRALVATPADWAQARARLAEAVDA